MRRVPAFRGDQIPLPHDDGIADLWLLDIAFNDELTGLNSDRRTPPIERPRPSAQIARIEWRCPAT